MASFSQDTKWMEAKRVVGHLSWLEVIAYYREIQGTNVFVYSIIDGEKRLIVDVLSDDSVLLLGKNGVLTDTYANVLNSRKVFKYSECSETKIYDLGTKQIEIAVESHN
ncbi:portal protein [Bacillus phage vB_BmeM-Goe8]|uniref:Uncharacterized protein n=1 Tax=Bacillus phage vB_BmeM-Goe8 TaxID=2593638 RepID=A0A516KMN0_9CAUD|nr:portal protein [Bacillus phage vB_BmeM-Goe8]QDP42843.1 hypothetical protein Goe8_c00700 [Bacillus phage vB_BmeM-Goe8]